MSFEGEEASVDVSLFDSNLIVREKEEMKSMPRQLEKLSGVVYLDGEVSASLLFLWGGGGRNAWRYRLIERRRGEICVGVESLSKNLRYQEKP